MHDDSSLRRLGRESFWVGLGSLAISLLVLRFRTTWSTGVIGDGDAWQNVWNLDHVQRWMRGEEPLLFTRRLWAPEGASLLPHTLSLTNSLPGAVAANIVGIFTSYNALVVASYVLAAVALYRLARRLGAGPAGAALGAFVFAVNPQRSARSLGHLNLLATGWIPLALEALWVATRQSGKRAAGAAVAAGAALALLAYSDWYLAVCGAIAATAFAVHRLVLDGEKSLLPLAAAAVLAAALVAPYALAVARESHDQQIEGHQAQWCGTACTSLLIPARVQAISSLTWPLTERNHQNIAEGAGYLGLLPLAATLWVGLGSRRERSLAPFLWAGAVGLLLSLGPKLRVFDRLLEIPLPYALAERLLPPLRVGGCPNRYIALVFLPLALGTALAATRLSARRVLLVVGALALAAEYAPRDPGVSLWPWLPPDPAMEAIAKSDDPGSVLDLDRTVPALIRQLRHGRAQTLGYLSRTPKLAEERRLGDPILGPLLDPRQEPRAGDTTFPALLRSRWNIAFIVADVNSKSAERASRLGLPEFARSDRSVVWSVPDPRTAASRPSPP